MSTWSPPEPDPPPAGWGGWVRVQSGLPSFERMKYARDPTDTVVWRYRGWGPWRTLDGFWGDPEQAARILRDGFQLLARQREDGSIVYEQEPLTFKARCYLRRTVRHGARATQGSL